MSNIVLEDAITQKYAFKPYSPDFPKVFEEEKKLLMQALAPISEKEIYHIGSTSVPGMGGKGVIDIITIVPERDFDRAHELVQKEGFTFDHTLDNKRSFLYKYYVDDKNKPRLIHLHITFFGSGEIEKALAFRECLRTDKKMFKKYESLKKKASALHTTNGEKYKKYKFDFIDSTVTSLLKKKKKPAARPESKSIK